MLGREIGVKIKHISKDVGLTLLEHYKNRDIGKSIDAAMLYLQMRDRHTIY